MSQPHRPMAPGDLAELHERASRPSREVRDALGEVSGDILVLGAGGKMGFHLTRMIQRGLQEIRSPWKVHAVSRFGSSKGRRLFEGTGIPVIATDLTESAALDRLPDADAIFYLAGVKFGTSAQPELLHQMNVQLPERTAERFADSRIVALSTGCVYGFERPARGGSVETDRLDPPGEYARSCVGRENAFASGRCRASLVRLNYSVDLRYGVLVDIALKVRAGEPIDVTTGWFNIIWQGDANRYIIASFARAARPPFVINVTGQRTLGVRETAEWFGQRFGKPVRFLGEEAETAWLSNAGMSRRLWGPPEVDELTLMEWVADWLERGGETLAKPTRFEVRTGDY